MRFNPNDEDRMVRDDYPFEDLLESYAKSTYAWTGADEDKILRITKSSLGTFNFCPKQYFFQNILRLETEEKDHHVRGNNVHDVTQFFFNEIFESIDDILEEIEEGNVDAARDKIHKLSLSHLNHTFSESQNRYKDGWIGNSIDSFSPKVRVGIQ